MFYDDARLFIAMFSGVRFCEGCGCVPKRLQPSQGLCTGYRALNEGELIGGMRRVLLKGIVFGTRKRSCICFVLLRKEAMVWHATTRTFFFFFQSFWVVCVAALELANDLCELAWNKASVSTALLVSFLWNRGQERTRWCAFLSLLFWPVTKLLEASWETLQGSS